ERNNWIVALNELKNKLVKISREQTQLYKAPFVVKELLDMSAMPRIKVVTCAAVIDKTCIAMRFLECGLYMVNLNSQSMVAVGGETKNENQTVRRLEYVEKEHLLVALAGPGKANDVWDRTINLIDGRDLKWIKLNDTRHCQAFAVGTGPAGATFLAAAVLSRIMLYEVIVTESKRHRRLGDMLMPEITQCLNWSEGALAVGYEHGFRIWNVVNVQKRSLIAALVNSEDISLSFLGQSSYEAEMLIEISNHDRCEYLLVFSKCAVYVDRIGRRTRFIELIFPMITRKQHGFAYAAPYLSVYSENQVDVFNVINAEWMQTLNLRL
ncbi:hypothetical protein PENTCL1PPCAC_9053, partial [Pristionchus entomophagus]